MRELKKVTAKNSEDIISFIVERRKSLGLTQTQLALYSNLARQSLSDIERGKADPSLSNILSILKLCGVKLTLEVVGEVENDEG